jgi:hypothetical protein
MDEGNALIAYSIVVGTAVGNILELQYSISARWYCNADMDLPRFTQGGWLCDAKIQLGLAV